MKEQKMSYAPSIPEKDLHHYESDADKSVKLSLEENKKLTEKFLIKMGYAYPYGQEILGL